MIINIKIQALQAAWLLLVISAFSRQIIHLRADTIEEPPFPSLFRNQNHPNIQREPIVRIVTESVKNNGPISSQEEYIDLIAAKHAYVMSDPEEVLFVSAKESLFLKYKPYKCDKLPNFDGLPADHDLFFKRYGEYGMPVFGAMGIWLAAEETKKVYSKMATGSVGVNNFQPHYHVWRYDHSINDLVIEMHFNDAFVLIEIVIMNSKETVLKTLNILSIKYTLDNREDILEIPVGFGCSVSFKEKLRYNSECDYTDYHWLDHSWSSSQIDLEVTATEIRPSFSNSSYEPTGGPHSTETLYVELAHSEMGRKMANMSTVLLSKTIKSKQQETRSVLNHMYGVGYHIDLRTGVCTVRRIKDNLEAKERLDEPIRNNLALEFTAAGLSLPFNEHVIQWLFTRHGQFGFIKQIQRNNLSNEVVTILEKDASRWPFAVSGGRLSQELKAKIMTTYRAGSIGFSKLDSLTLWLMPAQQDKIYQIYHFRVIKRREILTRDDVARTFDISEDCYLNDPTRRPGLDYAWVNLFYPMSSNLLITLMKNEHELKQIYYRDLTSSSMLSTFSVPRVEFMFSDEGLVVRLLLLDLPPYEMLLESRVADKPTMRTDIGELRFVLPDLGYCVRMCQLHQCLTMSFCKRSHECLVSPESTSEAARNAFGTRSTRKEDWSNTLNNQDDCVTFSTDRPETIKYLNQQRLASVIRAFQQQEYDHLELPRMPEELTMSRDERQLNDSDFKRVLEEYRISLKNCQTQSNQLLASLSLIFYANDNWLRLLPSRFSIENNPLDEFSLDYATRMSVEPDDLQLQDTSKIVEFFHAGLPGFHLDPRKAAEDQSKSHHRKLRSLPSVTYDQCALACLDSKCGVFSYCEHGEQCVMSGLTTAEAAKKAGLLTEDSGCLVSQRDYAQQFMKFENVERRPEWSGEVETVSTVNDCASSCITEKEFICRSFELCYYSFGHETHCYRHDQRQADGIHKATGNTNTSTDSRFICDHYERSYLAEFTAIELHSIKPERMKEFRTSNQHGKTTSECADTCLNELTDCSAFQFCYQPSSVSNPVATGFDQLCIMIQGKSSDNSNKLDEDGTEYVVDDDGSLESVRSSKGDLPMDKGILHSDDNCHVFALKPNSFEAGTRKLVMGQTMTNHERDELMRREELAEPKISLLVSFILALLSFFIAALASLGLIWAREKHSFVRYHMYQAREIVSKPLRVLTGRR